MLWLLLRRRIGDLNDRVILQGAGRSLLAALGMGVVIWGTLSVFSDASTLLKTILGMGVGLVVFFGLALALGIEEARSVPRTLLRRRG